MTSASVKLLRTQSDERLAALAAAGHERAFEAIVERYRRSLLRHCRRYLPEARAEDALQQALVSAWSALRRGDDVRELRPWLHRIVHNTSLNALRASGYDYEQLRDTLQGDGGPAELAERAAVVRQALAGLAALPERQREALLQIAVEGRSQDEVAEELGLSHGAVRQLVHRARRSLRTAATAVMPFPVAGWLASGGGARGDLVTRITELVAGAGGTATLTKAGAAAVLAGGAVSAPVVMDRVSERPAPPVVRGAIAAPPRQESERSTPVVVADTEQEPAAIVPLAAGGDGDDGAGGAAAGAGREDARPADRARGERKAGARDDGAGDRAPVGVGGGAGADDSDDDSDAADAPVDVHAGGDDSDDDDGSSGRGGRDRGDGERSARDDDSDDDGGDSSGPGGGSERPEKGGGEDDDADSDAPEPQPLDDPAGAGAEEEPAAEPGPAAEAEPAETPEPAAVSDSDSED